MIRRATLLLAAALLSPSAALAQSDPALSQCLLTHTGDADRATLVKWIFSVMAASPQVVSMSAVTPAQRAQLSKDAAHIFNRLVTVDCRSESVSAIKQKGSKALDEGFGGLGETAMDGLMSDPAVAKSMAGLLAEIDFSAWAGVMIDAGTRPDGKPLKGK